MERIKAIHYLTPAVALVIAVVWIGGQRRSMAVLEEQCSNLRKAIDARRSNGEAQDAAGNLTSASGADGKDKKPIDWKKIAAQMEESRNNGGMGEHVISSALGRWAKSDPVGALEWVRKNGETVPGVVTEHAKSAVI